MNHKSNNRSWSSQGRDDLPDSLQRERNLSKEFEAARCPLVEDQSASARISNTDGRGVQDKGSEMVRKHKPFPELRPKSVMAQHSIRHSFNNRWHVEQKRASRRHEHKDAFDHVDQVKSEMGLKSERTLERQ